MAAKDQILKILTHRPDGIYYVVRFAKSGAWGYKTKRPHEPDVFSHVERYRKVGPLVTPDSDVAESAPPTPHGSP